jgi:hypothetical protein
VAEVPAVVDDDDDDVATVSNLLEPVFVGIHTLDLLLADTFGEREEPAELELLHDAAVLMLVDESVRGVSGLRGRTSCPIVLMYAIAWT